MRLAASLLALALASAAAPALAADDPKKARAEYEEGLKHYNLGEFDKAVEHFKAAYLARADAVLLYNVAQAQRQLGQLEQAITTYRAFLRGAPKAKNRDEVEKLIADTEQKLLEKKQAEKAPPAAPAVPPPAPRHTPLPFVEPVTKHPFQTFVEAEGAEFGLVGVGVRKVFGFTVYAMALYVEDEPARKAFPRLAGQAGGADTKTLLKSGLVPGFIVSGDFGKHARLWFARDVSAADQKKSYREALGDDATDKAAPAVQKDAEAFLALFDRDVKKGEEMIIHTTVDGRIGVGIAGAPLRWGPTNPRIAHDVWDIWLGAKPINDSLKASLMERIDSLSR